MYGLLNTLELQTVVHHNRRRHQGRQAALQASSVRQAVGKYEFHEQHCLFSIALPDHTERCHHSQPYNPS